MSVFLCCGRAVTRSHFIGDICYLYLFIYSSHWNRLEFRLTGFWSSFYWLIIHYPPFLYSVANVPQLPLFFWRPAAQNLPASWSICWVDNQIALSAIVTIFLFSELMSSFYFHEPTDSLSAIHIFIRCFSPYDSSTIDFGDCS